MSASVQVRGQLMRMGSVQPFIMDSEDQAQVLRVGSKAPPLHPESCCWILAALFKRRE